MIVTDNVIEKACARNASAELIYTHRNGTVTTARVRLMELNADELLADMPMCLDKGQKIPIGVTIDIHVTLEGNRYQFETEILEYHRKVRLNSHQTVPGIALNPPRNLEISQRRAHLRISTVGYEPISVSLVKPHPKVPDACPIKAPVVPGWIVDLAVGGMAVMVDPKVYPKPVRGDHFFVTFELPSVDDDFNMQVVLRHWRVVERTESLRFGLAFVPWQVRQFHKDQQRLSRFIASHERQMLKRRK